MTLTLGIEAETRVTPAETKPACPFPATITIVPPTPGRVAIGVPIDMPFTEINKIVEAQFAGKTFPEDGSGSVDVTVKRASVAASGDRLLISLLVNAKEKKSFFGFGGEANVHIWGRPVLDQAQQTLRLTDIQLAVESEAAFGLLGAAARAAVPHLQRALAEKATIDLKPFASNAQKKIAAVIADFQKNEDGIRVGAEITVAAAGRHRLRFQNAARDRGSRRHDQRHGQQAVGAVTLRFAFRSRGLAHVKSNHSSTWRVIGGRGREQVARRGFLDDHRRIFRQHEVRAFTRSCAAIRIRLT